MALVKEAVDISFAMGLDTKSDPFRVAPGRFLSLQNSIFTKAGLLQKRNGFQLLTTVTGDTPQLVTTFNGNLTSVGDTLQALDAPNATWVNQGSLQPIKLSSLSGVRTGNIQTQADSVSSASGLTCIVYTDVGGGTTYKYTVIDSTTGQSIQPATTFTSTGTPRVFILANYFIILYPTSGNHLTYIAVSVSEPSVATAPVNLSSQFSFNTKMNYDAVVANNNLYVAWNGTDGGGAIRVSYLDSTLVQHTTVAKTGHAAIRLTIAVDTSASTAVVYVAFSDSSDDAYVFAVSQNLAPILTFTKFISTTAIANITAVATGGMATIYYEVVNAYSFDSGINTNIIRYRTCTSGGALGTATQVSRSVGLASKAFILNGVQYVLSAFNSVYQPTYFLLSQLGRVVAKLAYENGGGYLTTGLPNISVIEDTVSIAYLIKDFISTTNKSVNATNANPIYSQTGINIASFDFDALQVSSEIGSNLLLSGGFLWSYDGLLPNELNFNVFPDPVEISTSTSGGNITDQEYFYQVIYTWMDSQGNIHRSAPSVPVSVTTSGGNTSTNTVHVPTLRLSYKTNVRIEVYRWSVAQQTFYQVTSLTSPTYNNPAVDSVDFSDTLADTAIVGNSIIYTNGGVIEDTGAPATSAMTLFKSRLFLIDDEDPNLLWYSKQCIENTPVEMSDLFTIFVAPTTGTTGSTGICRALSAMDDKLIIFKRDAIYYLTGNGPDNTGANNDFSDPIFVTATVGCSNPRSIVFIPNGLMFQSDKGIWLLGRDLSTTYIGAPVEAFNDSTVLAAIQVPGTNQVRFTLDSGITLMYDYFYGQWGTFVGVPAVSSVVYQNLHTFVNSFGQIFQENPGSYLDGSRPVLLSFTTGWMNLAGLQGYERAYYFYVLGTYSTPHTLNLSIAYDYNSSATQMTTIRPDNFSPAYGDDNLWGSGSPYGGPGNVEQWRIFLQKQKCESFQIQFQEQYDPSFGVAAGAGLSVSGLNLVVGLKKKYRPTSAARSVG